MTLNFLKDELSLAKSYRHVCVLQCASEIFERFIKNQLFAYIDEFYPPFICKYGNSFSSLTSLSCPVEKWKTTVDSEYFTGCI